MANSEAAGGTQAEPQTVPQAGTPNTTAPVETPAPAAKDTPQAGDQEAVSLEELRKLRSEAAGLRRRLKEREDADKAAEDAALSEAEKLKRRVAELEEAQRISQEERRVLLTRSAVEREARKLQIVDEDAAFRLLEPDALEYGDDGQPTNVEKALKKLIERRPFLVSQAQPQAPLTPSTPVPVGATPRPSNGQGSAMQAELDRIRQQTAQRARTGN